MFNFDQQVDIAKYLLSVNFNYFGNLSDRGCCTLEYLVRNGSCLDINIFPKVVNYLKLQNLSDVKIDKIVHFLKNSDHFLKEQKINVPDVGSLFQIAVPKSRLNQVYISISKGIPTTLDFNHMNKELSDVLKMLSTKDPDKFSFDKLCSASLWQARLILTDELVNQTDGDDGIQVMRYDPISDNKAYQDLLNEVLH